MNSVEKMGFSLFDGLFVHWVFIKLILIEYFRVVLLIPLNNSNT